MEQLRQSLCRIALRFRLSAHDAEDIVQEAMLRLCAARSNGAAVLDDAAFARRTAANLAIERIRREKRRAARLDQIARFAQRDGEDNATPADVQRLYDAIARLPARQSAVITLRKLMELEYAEIGEILGISEEACRSHCKLALARLKKLLPE